MKIRTNKIWGIWMQNLICCHTTDEFLTYKGIHPFFRAGNYDGKLYRRRKRQCLYMLVMKELEITVWKETYALTDGNCTDNRFDTSGPQNLWMNLYIFEQILTNLMN